MSLRRPASRTPLTGLLALAVVATALSGCSSVRFGEETAAAEPVAIPALAGTWTGTLGVEGQGTVEGRLVMTQEGRELAGDLRIPSLGLDTSGAGTVTADGRVEMSFEYDLGCAGVAELDGQLSEEDRRMTGSYTADDCTGSSGGRFTFVR